MRFIVLLPLFLVAVLPETRAYGVRLKDYRCQQSNGYEAVARQCDVYVECKDNIAVQQTCPDGLHFNSKVEFPYYPCGYPTEVQCEASDAIQEAKPTHGCEHQHGFYRAASGDCDSYTLCHRGVAEPMSCPLGLVFNPAIAICDWPSNVPECDHARALEGYTCPEPAEPGLISTYRYGKSCSHFVACVDGYARILACDHDLSYSEESQSCVAASEVSDCDPKQ